MKFFVGALIIAVVVGLIAVIANRSKDDSGIVDISPKRRK